MEEIKFSPIGYINSPFKRTDEVPRQSIYAVDKTAIIELKQEYKDGLKDLDRFSHIVVLFYFHESKDFDLLTYPHGCIEKKGVFASRSPRRPNSIGLSIVKLLKIDECRLEIQGIDMLDGTPVLDIKPYFPSLNPQEDITAQ